VSTEISATDLTSERDAAACLALIDAYARDPMGGSAPLRAEVHARLVPDLRERIARGAAVVLIARRGGAALGIAVCFVGYSTFYARPLLNLHDLAVMPEARGAGIGQALLAAVASQARALGCCKVTLEVREDNARARRVYAHVGFADYSATRSATRTLFLEQKL
jgi:ribosomal protein S18 acetylase RimI-like enzyme